MDGMRFLWMVMALCCWSCGGRTDADASAPKREQPPSASTAQATAPASSPKITAREQCIVQRDGRLSLHVLLPIHFTSPQPSDQREIYQLDCSAQTRACEGLYLRLDNPDHARPIDYMDLGHLGNAQIVSNTGSVWIIQWGTYRTFTVDLSGKRGTVRYTESGDNAIASGRTEGRGETSCDIADGRRCTTDAQCLGGMQCYSNSCIAGETK